MLRSISKLQNLLHVMILDFTASPQMISLTRDGQQWLQ